MQARTRFVVLAFLVLLARFQCSAFAIASNRIPGGMTGTARAQKCESARLRASMQAPATWEDLSVKLEAGDSPRQELIADQLAGSRDVPSNRLVLFRDRNGWCPYSERVWLAMMEKKLDFDEVLINLQAGKPSWYSSVVPTSQTPAIRTAQGRTVHDSLRVLEFLEEEFPEHPLLPADASGRAEVLEIMNQFSKVMPSGARPSSRGAFLFKGWGSTFLPASEFEAALDGIEELLGRRDGPFFSGNAFGLADCAFAPFLERWSFQVPAVRPGLEPRDASRWPRVGGWFDAMEAEVPSYLARVKGDRHTWTLALDGAGGGDTALATDQWLTDFEELTESDAGAKGAADGAGLGGAERRRVWEGFAAGRGWVGQTAREEAGRQLWRGRERVAGDVLRGCGMEAAEKANVEVFLRVAATLLLSDAHRPQSAAGRAEAKEMLSEAGLLGSAGGAEALQAMCAHLGGRICSPRDMGVLVASEMRAQLACIYYAAADA